MKLKFLNIFISIGSYSSFVKELLTTAQLGQSTYTCVANVHMLIEAYNDSNFAKVVNNADMVTPDGMPLSRGIKFLYGIHQDRVAGMDILPNLLRESEKQQIKVLFYGGTPQLQKATESFVKKKYPNLKAVGYVSPPFRPLNHSEETAVINEINGSGAQFVFVALGCPKQEKWMASMKGKINACMIGIGGALPVMVGMQKRAPKWMQKASLEWLYRLSQEPKRLFKRYAITNTTFLFLLFGAWAKQGFRAKKPKVSELDLPASF